MGAWGRGGGGWFISLSGDRAHQRTTELPSNGRRLFCLGGIGSISLSGGGACQRTVLHSFRVTVVAVMVVVWLFFFFWGGRGGVVLSRFLAVGPVNVQYFTASELRWSLLWWSFGFSSFFFRGGGGGGGGWFYLAFCGWGLSTCYRGKVANSPLCVLLPIPPPTIPPSTIPQGLYTRHDERRYPPCWWLL